MLGMQERLDVLKQWVASGQNADQCESSLVLQRKSLRRTQGNEELLTLQQMIDRRIPVEKIRAVVARGGGVADPDAPGVAKLTSFWIETSRTRTSREEQSTTAEVRVAGSASGALEAMGSALDPFLAPGISAAAPCSDFDRMLADAQGSGGNGGGPASGSAGVCWGCFCCCINVGFGL